MALLLPGQCMLPTGTGSSGHGSQVRLQAQQGALGWHLVASDAQPTFYLYNQTGCTVQVRHLIVGGYNRSMRTQHDIIIDSS